MSDWKQWADMALVDLNAALATEKAAALAHLKDAASNLHSAIDAMEAEET